MAKQAHQLTVNGREHDVYAEPSRSLLEVVRDELRFLRVAFSSHPNLRGIAPAVIVRELDRLLELVD